jgi:DNA-directed RNA polymerase subunit RPC12/RpoP
MKLKKIDNRTIIYVEWDCEECKRTIDFEMPDDVVHKDVWCPNCGQRFRILVGIQDTDILVEQYD